MVDERMADRVVELMNEMLTIDPAATRALLRAYVACNDTLAVHPTIQCGVRDGLDGNNPGPYVGIMGVLNGLCGAHDDGPRKGYGGVCYDYEEGSATQEAVILRFRRLSNGAGE